MMITYSRKKIRTTTESPKTVSNQFSATEDDDEDDPDFNFLKLKTTRVRTPSKRKRRAYEYEFGNDITSDIQVLMNSLNQIKEKTLNDGQKKIEETIKSDLEHLMNALQHIKENAQKDGHKKLEKTITSVTTEIRSKFDELKFKVEKDCKNFVKAISKISKECESLLKNETAYDNFCKEKNSHLQASKETQYDVEAILGKRVVHGKTEYLVKWADFDETLNSWEQAENLSGVVWYVNAFEESLKDCKKTKPTPAFKLPQKEEARTRFHAKVPEIEDRSKYVGHPYTVITGRI